MSFTSYLINGTLLFALAFLLHSNKAFGAPRTMNRENEYRPQQPEQALQTEPLLDLEALRLPQQRVRNQLLAAPRQIFNMDGDRADVALVQRTASQPLIRSQRSFAPSPVQSMNQQSMEDEQILKRQLPDLILQARNDKDVERVLLRMLFNASLRPNLANVVTSHDYGTYNSNGAGGANTGNVGSFHGWQDALESSSESNSIPPRMSAHLEQATDSANSLANDLVQAYRQDQYPSYMDKREYIKPCSFNMVSCAKNPFRRL